MISNNLRILTFSNLSLPEFILHNMVVKENNTSHQRPIIIFEKVQHKICTVFHYIISYLK